MTKWTELVGGDSLRRLLWRGGRRLYCEARGEQRSFDIVTNGEADVQARVLAAIPLAVKMQAVDVGANEGAWTLSLLRQAAPERLQPSSLRVDAFEPIPSSAARFSSAIASIAGKGCVHLHGHAISSKTGNARMAVMCETGGTNSLHFEGSGAPPGGWVDVTLTSLPEHCAKEGITHIHLAKCDAEGHDLQVLTGARPMLVAQCIDVFQFEYNHRWVLGRAYLNDVFALVAGLPYKVARIVPGRIEVFDSWHPELERFFESNYVLVREPALSWFDARRGRFDVSNTYA
jgi:FkbM family methyltransferase